MIQEIECKKCKKEFKAKEFERGVCPYCNTKYDWYVDGEDWTESVNPIFDNEKESIKRNFLISRDWI